MSQIPFDLIISEMIEEEKKKQQIEDEGRRIQLPLPMPVPPPNYEDPDGQDNVDENRGVIIIDMFGDDEEEKL